MKRILLAVTMAAAVALSCCEPVLADTNAAPTTAAPGVQPIASEPPSAPNTPQTAWQAMASYIQSNGVLHAGLAWGLQGKSTGPLLAQSINPIDYTNSVVEITSGPAHGDCFTPGLTRDQIGWVVNADIKKVPDFIVFRRLSIFGYMGLDSDKTLEGKFSQKAVMAGGGFAFSF